MNALSSALLTVAIVLYLWMTAAVLFDPAWIAGLVGAV